MVKSTRGTLKTGLLAAFCVTCIALPMSAQERLPYRGGDAIGQNDPRAGARYVHPGALLLAMLDENKDLEITEDEIDAGARLAFIHADQDQNGVLTPLEQRAWAGRLSSETDLIANPRIFPSAIPNQVTEAEFVFGIITLSQRFQNEDGRVFMSALTFAPENARRDEDEVVEDDIERLRRPQISDHRNANGLQR